MRTPELERTAEPSAVARVGLLDRLSEHAGDVLVVAGPGYGKTTLVRQWSRRDETRWVQAIATVDPVQLQEPDAGDAPVTLVLDDSTMQDGSTWGAAAARLVRARSERVRVVVASRRQPTPALARLVASGELLELSEADLVFTLEEAKELLRLHSLEVSDDAVDLLHERTEGWPAALALAARALQRAAAPDAEARRFGGASKCVADYVERELLGSLSPEQREFVGATAILDTLSGPSCDAVIGREGSSAALIELEQVGGLLVPLDDRRETYRYHRLVSELLRHELRHAPGRTRELHRRAGDWLATGAQVGDAARHYLAADAQEAAIAVVAEGYMGAVERGEIPLVASWLELFPRRLITADARLSVVEAWAMSFLGRPAEAEAALENARRSGYSGPLPDGAGSIEATAALIAAGFPAGDVGRMLASARRAYELENRTDSPWRTTVHMMLGLALYFAGEPEEAQPLVERAAALARADERWLEEVGTRCVRAWIALDADRLDEAAQWANQARQVATRSGLAETPYGGYAEATLGAITAEGGKLQAGGRRLEQGIETMRPRVEPLMLAQCLDALAMVRLADHRPADARSLCAEAQSLLADFADPGTLGPRLEATAACARSAGASELTRREIEVLRMLDQGLSKREVAQELVLSYNTVHTHVKSIYRKLGASTRPAVLDVARATGII